MTKKHFIALADALKDNNAALTDRQINILADFCASTNPRFNRGRWIAYLLGECGPNGGVIK